MFWKIEHQGKVTRYDSVNKLFHIVYDGDYTKEYYHNEVKREYNGENSSQSRFISCTPSMLLKNSTIKYVKHVMTLTVKDIWSIASLRYNLDISTENVPIEIVQIVIILYNLTLSFLKKLLLATSPDKSSRSCQHGMIGRKGNTSNWTSFIIKEFLVMLSTLLHFQKMSWFNNHTGIMQLRDPGWG